MTNDSRPYTCARGVTLSPALLSLSHSRRRPPRPRPRPRCRARADGGGGGGVLVRAYVGGGLVVGRECTNVRTARVRGS